MSEKAQEPEAPDLVAEEPETAPPPAEPEPEGISEPEPVPEPPAEVAPVKPARSRSSAAIPAVLLIGAAATAFAWFDPLGWRAAPPQIDVAALTARLEAAEKANKALEDRLAKLESAPVVSAETVAALEKTVQENQASLGAIWANPAAGGEVSASQIDALAQSVARLEQQVASGGGASALDVKAAVDAALSAREAEANATIEAARQKAARIEAVQRLRDAARSGAPFADLLPALDGLTIDPILRDAAPTGLITVAKLAETFPEASRNALDASLRAADAGEGIGDRFYHFLRIQTGERSLEPREGTDPDAVLSRAEAAVKAGDVATALTELAGLPPEGQAEMAGWITTAQHWQTADKALNDLAAAAGVEGG